MAGCLIVSLDFELFWGMMDVTTLEEYGDNVRGGREAIPRLLELFQKHDIHATWATVGFQFAKDQQELLKYAPAEKDRPGYENKALDPYARLEETDQAECFYCPDLIRQVAAAPNQEIGSHTFCHYYCRERGQTPEQFRHDMEAALAIGRNQGYGLKSVVLPRNQCTPECIRVLKDLGFLTYRDEENDWIHTIKIRPLMRLLRLADVYLPLTGQGGYRPRNEEGIVNLMGSRMFKPIFPALRFLEGLKVRRIKAQMKHAAKKGLCFHLWWHPHNMGKFTDEYFRQLEEVFDYYDQLKSQYGMESLTMEEAADRFLKETQV